MLLIEDGRGAPDNFHYFSRRGGDDARKAAEDYLARQGCTQIIHSDDGNSYGIIEPREVIQQRIRMPQHG